MSPYTTPIATETFGRSRVLVGACVDRLVPIALVEILFEAACCTVTLGGTQCSNYRLCCFISLGRYQFAHIHDLQHICSAPGSPQPLLPAGLSSVPETSQKGQSAGNASEPEGVLGCIACSLFLRLSRPHTHTHTHKLVTCLRQKPRPRTQQHTSMTSGMSRDLLLQENA